LLIVSRLEFILISVIQEFLDAINDQELLAIGSKSENSYYSFDLYTGLSSYLTILISKDLEVI
jgi:hypothetical protein